MDDHCEQLFTQIYKFCRFLIENCIVSNYLSEHNLTDISMTKFIQVRVITFIRWSKFLNRHCCTNFVLPLFRRRGIPAKPILDGYCGDYEFGFPESMGIYKQETQEERPNTSAGSPVWSSSSLTFTLLQILAQKIVRIFYHL